MTNSKHSRDSIDQSFEAARKIENALWKQINDQGTSLEIAAILVASLAGRLTATISQTKAETRVELHALYANVFWKTHQEVTQTIPEVLFGERLQKILDDVLGENPDSTH